MDDPRTIDQFTVGELVAVVLDRVNTRRQQAGPGEAARDFSLAITAFEDGLTRYNSGRYREKGTWLRADPDQEPPPLNAGQQLDGKQLDGQQLVGGAEVPHG